MFFHSSAIKEWKNKSRSSLFDKDAIKRVPVGVGVGVGFVICSNHIEKELINNASEVAKYFQLPSSKKSNKIRLLLRLNSLIWK